MVRFATAAAALAAAALSAPSAEAFLPPWHAAAPLPNSPAAQSGQASRTRTRTRTRTQPASS